MKKLTCDRIEYNPETGQDEKCQNPAVWKKIKGQLKVCSFHHVAGNTSLVETFEPIKK